jgi:hypothetical protein
MAWMEDFLYPLILLLIGAGVTSLLLPWFTKRWEDRKKELEIKVDIVSKMAEVRANVLAEASIVIEFRKEKVETEKVYENLRKWYGEVNIIRSKLQSYYGDTELATTWFNYWTAINNYY